ncbi:MAG: hypothetical protein RBS99_16400 [Rhodospirillales bacterium]|nr:hypothetical protein [Rhodospirillales bacterium]
MAEIENRWWEPGELAEFAHGIRVVTPDEEFFCDPAFKKVREAINLSEFASRRPWNRDWQIRPVPDREGYPDAELRSDDEKLLFEVVEADRRRRRRCSEYRAERGLPQELEEYDPGEEAETALEEVSRVIKQKVKKLYRPKPHLLVYVNFFNGEPTSLYASQLYDKFGRSFESVWLLWQSGTFRLWPNPAKIKV